ncbi:MAG TPA: L-ribulose-5-phosphate 4-epimerase [Aggregatilineaceae bacterium]|nr:L-ribulose-5-phosphate 4-epimerase [Aggregatilineaceae bacterium]
MLEKLRRTVSDLHAELPDNHLVAWTSGNVSGRDPQTNQVVIKPSGLRFGDLGPETMVVVDLEAKVLEGNYKPSSDTATHCYIYRHMPHINGIVHTHSSYATAWATLGRDIPCILTAMADEFGGVIPCGGFALIGGEEIGKEVVRVLREGPNPHSPAVILQNHGVFTVGPTPEAAVKAAIMCEDVARTVYLAYQLGEPIPISEENIAKLYKRYTNDYGQ